MPKSNADVVNTWAAERLAGGDIGRHTPAYNQAMAAVPDLIARLEANAAPAAKPPKTAKAAGPAAEPPAQIGD